MNATEINIFFNCLLIRNGLRTAYLSEHNTKKSIEFMRLHFPELIVRQSTHAGCHMWLVSKMQIDDHELNDSAALGRLLGYPGAEEFKTLDPKNAYVYCFEYTTNTNSNTRRLFGNKCATEKDAEHTAILRKIRDSLEKSDVLRPYGIQVWIQKNKYETLIL
jgi:hypothetical protein